MLCKSLSGKSRIAWATPLSMLLFSALIGTLFVNSAAAQQTMNLTVQSPESKVYTQNSISVEFTVSNFTVASRFVIDPVWHLYLASGFKFLLDAQVVNRPVTYSVSENNNQRTYRCRALLPDLPEGTHMLTIFVTAETGSHGGAAYPDQTVTWTVTKSVTFTVDAAAPRVSILSLKPAETYNSTVLPLEFAVSEPTASLSYSLDGGASVAIAGNTTLYGLSRGTHTIVVQAEDSAGSVGSSAPVTFTVETAGTEQPGGSQPAPLSTTFVAVALIVTVAIVSFGLVAYLLRRKKRRSK
jgi:hypothetical protein